MNLPPTRGPPTPADEAMAAVFRQMTIAPQGQTWSFDGIPGPDHHPNRRSDRRVLIQIARAPQDATSSLPIRRRRQQGLERPSSPTQNLRNRPDRSTFNRNFTEPPPRARRRPLQNPFGTREELESEDYQSPIEGMFTRAWNGGSEAEEARRSNQIVQNTRMEWEPTEQAGFRGQSVEHQAPVSGRSEIRLNQHDVHTRNDMTSQLMSDVHQAGVTMRRNALLPYDYGLEPPLTPMPTPLRLNPIDAQTSRPAPLSREDLTVSIACQVCYEQRVDTLLEPCMHIALCRWCSEIVRQGTRRIRSDHGHDSENSTWRCPICRRRVTNARRVFLP
jgi:hypothetical protein